MFGMKDGGGCEMEERSSSGTATRKLMRGDDELKVGGQLLAGACRNARMTGTELHFSRHHTTA